MLISLVSDAFDNVTEALALMSEGVVSVDDVLGLVEPADVGARGPPGNRDRRRLDSSGLFSRLGPDCLLLEIFVN